VWKELPNGGFIIEAQAEPVGLETRQPPRKFFPDDFRKCFSVSTHAASVKDGEPQPNEILLGVGRCYRIASVEAKQSQISFLPGGLHVQVIADDFR
jgi:hypothetical protein